MKVEDVIYKSFMKNKDIFRKIMLLELLLEAIDEEKDFPIMEFLFYKVDFTDKELVMLLRLARGGYEDNSTC